MRRAVKPFTVELRKKKKPGQGAAPLFSDAQLALAQPSADKSGSPAPANEVDLRRVADAELIFRGRAASGSPVGRVLPDLTPQRQTPEPEPPSPYEEIRDVVAPRRGRPRRPPADIGSNTLAKAPTKPAKAISARPTKTRGRGEPAPVSRLATAPKPTTNGIAAKPVQPNTRRAQRRLLAEAVLRAGERWKRRLPPGCW